MAQGGTPPRMRGKSREENTEVGGGWDTPAYAGKTQHPPFPQVSTWEHPRVCGENPHSKNNPSGFQGTPPRMRGKRFTTSAFTGRNLVLASLRATNPTLQHAHRTRQTRRNKKRPTGAYVLLTLPDSRQGTLSLPSQQPILTDTPTMEGWGYSPLAFGSFGPPGTYPYTNPRSSENMMFVPDCCASHTCPSPT